MIDFNHQDENDEKENGRNRATNTGVYVAKVLVATAWANGKLIHPQNEYRHKLCCGIVAILLSPQREILNYTVQCLNREYTGLGDTVVNVDDICHELNQLA